MKWFDDVCKFCEQARWCITAILAVGFVVWGIWGWSEVVIWYEDSSPSIQFGQGYTADESVVYPNQVIVFYQPIKKMRDCFGRIQRVVTGQCGHFVVSETKSTVPSGFKGRLTIVIQVPHEAIPGPCGFQVHARYYCNLFDYALPRQSFVSPIIPFTVRNYN